MDAWPLHLRAASYPRSAEATAPSFASHIGVRVPQAALLRALLETVGEPLLGTTLQLPGEDTPLTESDDIEARLSGRVDLVLDGGRSGLEPTTVIDLTGDQPLVVRIGCGPVDAMLGKGR